MKQIIKKELVLGGILFLVGLLAQYLLGHKMIKGWTAFSIILALLFISSTLLFNWLMKIKPDQIGLLFAGVTLLIQAILLSLLFIVLKPTEENHRAFAILGLSNYLLFLLLDTRWKLKWFFKSTP
ncbi:MAG TPA: hypothetical protein VKY45_08075 [Marinilabiliaceae bacterium]|nr:hypothetical protein [Marinilabiliaceae bacterium]